MYVNIKCQKIVKQIIFTNTQIKNVRPLQVENTIGTYLNA